ncbi:MAG: CDP-glycerol glycerophosphotransferase family protein, partial [Streptosporangiales bacterium]|nr:CDP-glycerol glycerophosphotransferase family protein [Streptosporangiales bacterium]
IASFLLFALSPGVVFGFLVGAVAIAIAWYRYRRSGMGKAVVVRLLVLTGVITTYAPSLQDGNDFWLLAATALTMAVVVNESIVSRAVGKARLAVANLDGISARDEVVFDRQLIFHADIGMVVLIGAFAAAGLPSWPLALAAGVVCVGVATLLLDARRLIGKKAETWAAFRSTLEVHDPAFAVYFSGPPGGLYQLSMWLPYFERLGLPYVVVLREGHSFNTIRELTNAPVVQCTSIASLDNVATMPNLHAAFYVNNGMKNSHFVKYRHITHIQLLHGDSDKPPSYNPVTGMYDRIFVAGRAGVDRYANHGVHIPETKFDVVGRPQVETIDVTDAHIGDKGDKVVLYAPTWTGYSEDVNYCSLPAARKMLRRLLDRDVTVILREHPYTAKNPESARQLAALQQMLDADTRATGRRHLFGSAASVDLTLVECFNRADAMISDVSGVVSDFLFSKKPFAITDMVDEREEFIETFPLARAAYVFRRDMSNVDDVLDQLLKVDPLEATRRQARTYYLGDYPVETYAEAFVERARHYAVTPHELVG